MGKVETIQFPCDLGEDRQKYPTKKRFNLANPPAQKSFNRGQRHVSIATDIKGARVPKQAMTKLEPAALEV